MDVSFIPTHHELIVIEHVFTDALTFYNCLYDQKAERVDTLDNEDEIVLAMQELCRLHDKRLEVKVILQRFKDYRIRDYKNKTYL